MRPRPALLRALLTLLPVVLGLSVLLGRSPQAAAQRAIFLVRHAEKVDESRDPPLSTAGQARAQRLAELLARAGLSAVFTSEYRRTAETARPLATALKLVPQVVPAADRAALISKLRARSTETVLVVGHSDTLPLVLKDLGVASPPPITDYGDLLVCVPVPGGPPTLVRLRF